MNNHIASKIMRLLDRRELKENLAKLARVLSCVAVFCITYILVAPVLTEEWPAVCGMEEHVHDESCYEEQLVTPEPELICGLEEGGHVHTTDGCYTAVRGDLMCTETGTEEAPHVHDDSCYAWSYELTCTESEEGHTHTEACWAPAGEPSVQKVLICTLPEHTHTDACYHAPEENPAPEYICGFLSEHAHDDSCYFEDGSLKCTVPEHTHTDACLAPAEGEEIVTVPVDAQFTYENEMVSIAFTITGDATMRQPAPAEAPVEEAAGEETAPETEPVLELVVTEDESTDAYAEYEEIAEEEGDVMLLQVLNYGLTLNGTALDLSNCDVTVEAVPTQQLQAMMDAPQDVGLMTVDTADETGAPEESNMEYRFSAYADRPGTVAYSVTQGANATFYVQYYAWMDRLVTENGTGTALDVIDTSYDGTENEGKGNGGRLPQNVKPTADMFRKIYVGADGKAVTENVLTEIYKRGGIETREGYPGYGTPFYEERKGSRFSYFDAPGLQYFNMVSNVQDIQYSINTIWIQKGGNGDPTSTDEKDWTVLPYTEGRTRFTNRPETAAANQDYILIEADDVIRLVYTPKTKDEVFPADFYDYDISDGKHDVNSKIMTVSSGTSTNYGINSGGNQSNRIAFGNAGGGTTKDLAEAKNASGIFINQRNAEGSWPNRYNTTPGGGTFGLVAEMNEAGNDVVFNQGIVGPNLFGVNPDTTTGKTHVKNIDQIQFNRVGDTYTLTAIPNTVAQNLSHFQNDSGIWNNSFWPMDSADTWGTKGHDIKFGAGGKQYKGYNKWAAGNKYDAIGDLAGSDDGKDHNSYFGMNFAVEFELTKNYIGPLEYYFFGDDDMWAFVSEVTPDPSGATDSNGKVKTQIVPGTTKQIVDIGGVHPSVGQYVNLWDYVNTNSWEDNARKTYRLTFFYTERGASGSTCWMQFTLPTVVGVDLESQIKDLIKEDTGTIRIEKQMGGIEGNEPFEFELKLTGADDYKIEYLYRNADGTVSTGKETEAGAAIGNNGKFKLQPGEIMVIHNLPKNTEYTITELGDSKQGYHTKIRTEVDGTVTDTKEFGGDEAAVATGSVTPGQLTSVTFINIASYELPATGGSGTAAWYLTGGMLVLLGLGLLTVHSKQKRGKAVS